MQESDNVRRIALYRSIRHHGTLIVGEERFARLDGYIRASEFVEVTFALLGAGDIASSELDHLRQEIDAEYARKLQALDSLRARVASSARQAVEQKSTVLTAAESVP